jgi:hypothetical protein
VHASPYLEGRIRAARKAREEVIGLREEIERRGIPFDGDQLRNYIEYAYFLVLASTLPGKAGLGRSADRAVEALGRFIKAGFDNAWKRSHDPRLAPLRDRDDFKALVKELEAKVSVEPKK